MTGELMVILMDLDRSRQAETDALARAAEIVAEVPPELRAAVAYMITSALTQWYQRGLRDAKMRIQ